MNKALANTETIRFYSKRNGFKIFSVIFLEWLIIITNFCLCLYFNQFSIYLLGIFIIATRMYAFYSLAHEACHYQLFQNKKLNDWIGNVFLAWPIFIDIHDMRKIHFLHHKHLQTKEDPEIKHLDYDEFQFPLEKNKLLLIFFKDIIGYNFIRYRLNNLKWLSSFRKLTVYQTIYYCSVIAIFAVSGKFLLCISLWIIPYMTIYQLLNRIRLYYEHFNLPDQLNYKTRTLHLPIWSAFFIAPHGLGYHADHHLFPSVPFYNLRKLHNEISKTDEYINGVIVERNYLSLIGKYLKKNES